MFALLLLPLYIFAYIAWYSLVLFVGFCQFVIWLCRRTWQTRPRAASPQMAASHLWSNRAARCELRRVQHVKPPRKAQKLYTEPWVLHGHVYEKASLDRAWRAS